MPRNPNWAKDELILALELFFRVNPLHTSDENPEIIRLSETLNALPIHPPSAQGGSFRNANGVYMKLCNFLRFDPDYEGSGLTRGNMLEKVVWDEFAGDRPRLKAVADAIVAAMDEVPAPADAQEAEVVEDEEFAEGRVLTRLHRRRERSRSATRKKKANVFAATGSLACEVCGFDFFEKYGALGEGFAECHHRKPLSEITSTTTTRLSDLAIVCANCHRMLHRSRPWRSVEALAELLNRR